MTFHILYNMKFRVHAISANFARGVPKGGRVKHCQLYMAITFSICKNYVPKLAKKGKLRNFHVTKILCSTVDLSDRLWKSIQKNYFKERLTNC